MMTKKFIATILLLLTVLVMSGQENPRTVGLSIGHRAPDSLRVSNLNAGIVAATDTLRGLQLSLVSTMADDAAGLQLSPFSNVAYGRLRGLQLSGINNIVLGEARGLQLTGYSNLNVGTLKGVQVAFRNNTDTLCGVQIGLSNFARHYKKGVQIGLVNFTRDTLSRRIGLVNINPGTRIDLMGFAGTQSKFNVAVRFRNRSTYNILGMGTHYMGLDEKFSGAFYYRIGQYFRLSPRLSVSGDLGYAHIETFEEHSNEKPARLFSLEARVNLDYQLTSRLGLFGTVGYGDTRYYHRASHFRNRVIGEVGLTYRYAGYSDGERRAPHLHSDADMSNSPESAFALPQKPNIVRTIAMITAVNAFVQRWDAWVLNEDFAKISIHTVKNNFKDAFVWDNDNFSTNLFAHPYHGNLYYNSARANGLSYWQSFPCAVGGSLMWEFFGEITPPAINDLLATSVGGTCIGEVTYRISDLFYDDRERGFSRVLRELGGAIVSPMKGLKRVLTGEAWRTKGRHYLHHDYNRIPVSYRLSVGSRYLADDNAFFRGEHNPYVEFGMEYGDAYDNEENKPFDYFVSNVCFGLSGNQPLINRLNLMGRIWGTPVSNGDHFEADLGIFQHFNFYNSEAVKDGTDLVPYRISEAASVGPGFICRFPQFEEFMNLEQRIFLSGILLGGSLGDYIHIGERDYNMGSGFSVKVQNHMDIYKYGFLDFDANYFHIFTWKGLTPEEWKQWEGAPERVLDYINVQGDPGNAHLLAFNASFGLYLSRHLTFDMKGSYFLRRSHYRYYNDVKARTFEVRAGLTYNL